MLVNTTIDFIDEKKNYPSYINVLFNMIKKIQKIINELNPNNIDEMKNKMTELIIVLNRIIRESDRNLKEINSKIVSLSQKQINIPTEQSENTEYENGIFYGKVKEGKKEGQGIYKFNNGETYIGEFKNDLREGIGIYYYKDGSSYNGNWKKDKKHGYGIYSYPDNEAYVGEWKYGKYDGLGIFFYRNGDKYVGEVNENHRDGFGMKISENKTVELLKYSQDKKKKSYGTYN
jgi:hypothetical protein